MKKSPKKLIIIIAAVLVLFSCAVAIGDNDTAAPDETTASTTILSEVTSEKASAQSGNESTQAVSQSTTQGKLATTNKSNSSNSAVSLASIPEYSGKTYVALNNNVPQFTDDEITTKAFERYSSLDYLGRCGVAFACLGIETMPTEERGPIGMVKPSGWHSVKYDCVDGKYLYNRCHLIGFQLSAENANTRNLITGTRHLNVQGMLPFENMVADYIKETDNHVMYRVTPVFEGENLVCKGVIMEAYSVEDKGEGICFNVFCYNAQPSIKINYKNGESCLMAQPTTSATTTPAGGSNTTTPAQDNEKVNASYILNTSSKKFHRPDCYSVGKMADKNKKEFKGDRNDLISDGYTPCKNCNP
jgi:DNA-entry nuclease